MADFDLATVDKQDDFNLSHIEDPNRAELQQILSSYSDIFSDAPGRTTLCTHKIELKPGARPIRFAPYRANPEIAD